MSGIDGPIGQPSQAGQVEKVGGETQQVGLGKSSEYVSFNPDQSRDSIAAEPTRGGSILGSIGKTIAQGVTFGVIKLMEGILSLPSIGKAMTSFMTDMMSKAFSPSEEGSKPTPWNKADFLGPGDGSANKV